MGMPNYQSSLFPRRKIRSKLENSIMNWIQLTGETQLAEIKQKSYEKPQIIFKYSTRCSTSTVVLNRIERIEKAPDADFYFLDLLAHRAISNQIAADFQVHHQSPQLLLIKNGECIYEESHLSISLEEIIAQF